MAGYGKVDSSLILESKQGQVFGITCPAGQVKSNSTSPELDLASSVKVDNQF